MLGCRHKLHIKHRSSKATLACARGWSFLEGQLLKDTDLTCMQHDINPVIKLACVPPPAQKYWHRTVTWCRALSSSTGTNQRRDVGRRLLRGGQLSWLICLGWWAPLWPTGGAKQLDELARKASSVLGAGPEWLEVVVEQRAFDHWTAGCTEHWHPMQVILAELRGTFSNRARQLHCSELHCIRSFLLSAIRLDNESPHGRAGNPTVRMD